jgi:hypothetical protein
LQLTNLDVSSIFSGDVWITVAIEEIVLDLKEVAHLQQDRASLTIQFRVSDASL